MFVDGYLLFAIYFIAVLALAVSAVSLWSLEEIRRHYERIYDRQTQTYTFQQPSDNKKSTAKGQWG